MPDVIFTEKELKSNPTLRAIANIGLDVQKGDVPLVNAILNSRLNPIKVEVGNDITINTSKSPVPNLPGDEMLQIDLLTKQTMSTYLFNQTPRLKRK